MMQTALKQFCYPVNFLACAKSKNVHAIIGQSFLNIVTGIALVQKELNAKSLKYITSPLNVTLLN